MGGQHEDAKAPASATSVIGNNYYVFLSFRGPDTRNGFVDHLYHRLNDVGLPFHPNFVFRDDENLPFGEKIGENLISAIKHSKVSIPVISENYAASEWCLRELIQIMECMERGEQKVLPVLYKVTLSEVRKLEGAFGKAFKSSMHLFKEDVKQQGPEALIKAVASRVFESEKVANGHEAELVKELVRVIMDEQQQDFLPPLPGNLVGIDDRVAEVMKLADTDQTRIIGICGIGGIGKTTLASNIYNKLATEFEWRSFLMDIRGTIEANNIEHIQNVLISDITGNRGSHVPDSMRGIVNIQSSCNGKKVLIVLDNVGDRDHLDKLIGGCNFGLGSRIIITCRDKALLESEYKCYELKEMNDRDSMLLFCLHAFGAIQPPTEVATLSGNIVATAGGLPLMLEIIGSSLKRKGKDEVIWTETLEKLKKVPPSNVREKLKMSYDSLDDEEKRMFLDIACFFIGTDKRIITYLWKDLGLCPTIGLARMIDLSLIKYGDNNELRMHDQLRDLGRDIDRSAAKEPWDRSRLWGEEAMKVLRRKEENENIEALHLDERGSREFIERESFKKMPNLKFLHVKDVDFYGDFEGSLAELRWLKLEGCPSSFTATNVHLEKLVVLDLSKNSSSGNYISANWRGWSSIKMETLKVLNLSRCSLLRSTPNLSMFKNLEMLILKYCCYIKEIDPSIGDVKHLVSLNLSHCRSLKKLPEQLGELKELEELVLDETLIKEIPSWIGSLNKLKRLSACWQAKSSLEQIPSSIGKLGELVELDLSFTNIKELPESIGDLNKLKILTIRQSSIERLPSSIGKLQSLQKFDANRCYNLEGQILLDKGGLSCLKTLGLRYTKISGLTENLDQLSSLEHLDLGGCEELQSLLKLPFSLSSLWLTCRSNELSLLSHLKHLKELTLDSCKSLQRMPSLFHLKCLRELHLSHCWSLQSIAKLPSCIRTLSVWVSPKLESLPNLSNLEFLSELMLLRCEGLKELDGLEALKSLRVLRLKLFAVSSDFPNGIEEGADNLGAIGGLEKLGSLEVVDISGRKHIQVLDLSKSEHLKKLDVSHCESLVEIRCPSQLLEDFDRKGCKSLKKLSGFLPHYVQDLQGRNS